MTQEKHDPWALLAEVERLTAERDRLTGLLDKVSDNHIASQLNGAREAIARKAAEAEVERLTAEIHRMKSRPVEAEFSRLDTMWQQLVRERDEAVHELGRLKGVRSKVNTAKLNDAFTEGTLKAGDAMRPLVAAAFARGVAAMRDAAAQKVTSYNIVVVDPAGRAFPVLESPLQTLADELRALPDPEDKS